MMTITTTMTSVHVAAMFAQSGYRRAAEVLTERKAPTEFARQLLGLKRAAEARTKAEAADAVEAARRAVAASAEKVEVLAPQRSVVALSNEEQKRRAAVAKKATVDALSAIAAEVGPAADALAVDLAVDAIEKALNAPATEAAQSRGKKSTRRSRRAGKGAAREVAAQEAHAA
jgi:hypothetical protein